MTERFCFSLQEPIADTEQIGCFWQYNLSEQIPGQYSQKIIFR